MEIILDLLNESRQSTLFPVFQVVGVLVSVAVPILCAGIVIAREEVNAALRMANISHKEAALTIGISEGLLSRKLSGDKPLTFESLEKLPAIFWQWFYLLGAEHYGVPSIVQTGAIVSMERTKAGGL